DFSRYKVLVGHGNSVECLSWSHDSRTLLSGSNDKTLRIWDVQVGVWMWTLITGQSLRTFRGHSDSVTSCSFLPDGQHFVSSGVDKNMLLWNAKGQILHKWTGLRVTDVVIPATGGSLLAISERRIRVYSLATKEEVASYNEEDSITSASVTADARYLMVNLNTSQKIHLWDLKAGRVIKKYGGHKQGLFVIRSCFGGIKQNFVLSGSEDSNVYIWNREQEILIESLKGHTGCVNSITWNASLNLFASASDDHTIRIWGTPTSTEDIEPV
ncbi:hypothetical protein HK405_012163, partial [Cladochytrium tenue]